MGFGVVSQDQEHGCTALACGPCAVAIALQTAEIASARPLPRYSDPVPLYRIPERLDRTSGLGEDGCAGPETGLVLAGLRLHG